jgi:phosphonate transport system substrate-binding protein
LRDNADIGFMPVDAFEALSGIIRRDLHVLVTSQLHVIHHSFLIGPALLDSREKIAELLVTLHETEKGGSLLAGLGCNRWRRLEHEDVELMIDIISTLTQ